MNDSYKVAMRPLALPENQITGINYRITVLTKGLIRLEYSEDGVFEDRGTQMAFYRDFPKADYRLIHTQDGIEIHTSRIQLIYNEKEFSPNGLSIQVKGNFSAYHSIWRYGEEIHDLMGTARTLDEADGAVKLDHGILSYFGYSLIDDSRSQVLLEDGWVAPRKKGICDLYFFGYGHDYKEALKDFYYLCGNPPMLPRFALGNWWSRFYAYTEESYLDLMDRFEEEQLPFTVAVIDMDWHLVDIDPEYGSGWTGYTWNRELFPDPARFLRRLHEKGLKTTLNVHPAEGVKPHEEMYEEMAKSLGVDYTKKDPVNFDPANPEYMERYFQYLHHPREEEGVDFWWIDWQQGNNSKVEGLDPLWILNHYHFMDHKRLGKRPMTFSRYAGPGSHRYPVGFSGDSIITWESLAFQPYFTANASNIGYGWWSHDIGGHMLGYKDDEMTARWTQFGVYSPILRLHSSNSEFNGKEPWRLKQEAREAMGEALRERHRMIPYLYSMNYRNYQDGLPLICPMYYEHPDEKDAYQVPNQYYFGSELIVAPITSKRAPNLNMASVTVWLPKGLWYDIHTGMMYDGGRNLVMYRDLNSVPVLAKAGGILPFTREITSKEAGENPHSLWVRVFAGADGAFTLYEDDNETCGYETGISAKTLMSYCDQSAGQDGKNQAVFTIEQVKGETTLIPETRSYQLEFTGFLPEAVKRITVTAGGRTLGQDEVTIFYNRKKQSVVVELEAAATAEDVNVFLPGDQKARENAVLDRIFACLDQAEIEFCQKDRIYSLIQTETRIPVLLTQLCAMEIDTKLYEVLLELLTGL